MSAVSRTLTIVVPAHDAGAALVATVRRVAEVVQEVAPAGGGVVVVDDGSTDGSVDSLRNAMAASADAFPDVEVRSHPERRGKGAALLTGFRAAPATWVGFCDGDGDIDPDVLLELAARAGLGPGAAAVYPRPDAVCAVKSAAAHLPVLRRVASELFKLYRRAVLPLGIDDSQTGAKLFAGGPLAAVLPGFQETGFAFDLEALAALRASGHGRFATVPTSPKRVSTSSVTPRSVLQLAWATIRLAARYRRPGQRVRRQ